MFFSSARVLISESLRPEFIHDFLTTQDLTRPIRLAIDWAIVSKGSHPSLNSAHDHLKDYLWMRRVVFLPIQLIETGAASVRTVWTIIIPKAQESVCETISTLIFEHLLVNIRSLCLIEKGLVNKPSWVTPYDKTICKTISSIGLALTLRKLYLNLNEWRIYEGLTDQEKESLNVKEAYSKRIYILLSIAGNINNLVRKNFDCPPLCSVILSTLHWGIHLSKYRWEYTHFKHTSAPAA